MNVSNDFGHSFVFIGICFAFRIWNLGFMAAKGPRLLTVIAGAGRNVAAIAGTIAAGAAAAVACLGLHGKAALQMADIIPEYYAGRALGSVNHDFYPPDVLPFSKEPITWAR